MPAYDRKLHDPVADATVVATDTRLVLIEGLYIGSLVEHRDPQWRIIRNLLDLTLFLNIPVNVTRRRLLNRKLQQDARKSKEEILQHIESVDVPTHNELVSVGDRLTQWCSCDGTEALHVFLSAICLGCECRSNS